jgi:colicin import membrane protein
MVYFNAVAVDRGLHSTSFHPAGRGEPAPAQEATVGAAEPATEFSWDVARGPGETSAAADAVEAMREVAEQVRGADDAAEDEAARARAEHTESVGRVRAAHAEASAACAAADAEASRLAAARWAAKEADASQRHAAEAVGAAWATADLAAGVAVARAVEAVGARSEHEALLRRASSSAATLARPPARGEVRSAGEGEFAAGRKWVWAAESLARGDLDTAEALYFELAETTGGEEARYHLAVVAETVMAPSARLSSAVRS